MAVGLANQSTNRAFELTMEQITGRVTHQVLGPPAGLPESLYRDLRLAHPGLPAAPVVEGQVELAGEPFTLLGVDPLSERPFRGLTQSPDGERLQRLLGGERGILVSAYTATRLGLEEGSEISLEIAGRQQDVRLMGRFGDPGAAAVDGILVADIALAQTLLRQFGLLDRIDLRLDPASAAMLGDWLPAGFKLVETGQRTDAMANMSHAFQTNLSAMSLLALLVGGFLIYNTTTFSVLQRRRQFGIMRLLGATRRQVFRIILLEQLLIGLIGTLLGIGAGILLARELLRLVTRTINDLYFALTVSRLDLSPEILLTGLLLGLLTTALAAVAPAWEATRSQPHTVNRRSAIEQRSHRALPWLLAIGLLGIAGGWLLVQGSERSLLQRFAALFCFIMGYCLLVPAMIPPLSRLLQYPVQGLFGTIGRLASRGIDATLSRTGPAIAALTLAIAATIGMGIMVDSFRSAVSQWLSQTIQGDIYVSAPESASKRASAALPETLPEQILRIEGVKEISSGRHVRVESENGPVELLAIGLASTSYRGFEFKGDTLSNLWLRFAEGETLLISEPYAFHHRLATGATLQLLTPAGNQSFSIGGVFQDYGSDRGLIVLPRDRYQALWNDPSVTTLGIYLAPGATLQPVLTEVRQVAGQADRTLRVRASREILAHSLEIFDRTFTITRVLRLLVIAVAFVGILSAMLALQLERAREHAILRATGMTPGQLLGQVSLQTLLMGLMAALLAMPLGWLMSEILIQVINLRAFGWSMPGQLNPVILLEAIAFALLAALLAGLYPSLRMARTAPAAALREE